MGKYEAKEYIKKVSGTKCIMSLKSPGAYPCTIKECALDKCVRHRELERAIAFIPRGTINEAKLKEPSLDVSRLVRPKTILTKDVVKSAKVIKSDAVVTVIDCTGCKVDE